MTDQASSCAKCGRSMPLTARRCVYCGAVKGKQCPKCKAVCPPGASVCLFCRADIPATVPDYVFEGHDSDKQSDTEAPRGDATAAPPIGQVKFKLSRWATWLVGSFLLLALVAIGMWMIWRYSNRNQEPLRQRPYARKPTDSTADTEYPNDGNQQNDAPVPVVHDEMVSGTQGASGEIGLNGKVTNLGGGACRIEYDFDTRAEGIDWGAGEAIEVRDGSLLIRGKGKAVGAKLKVPIRGNCSITASYRMVSVRGGCGILMFSTRASGDHVGYVVTKEGAFRAYKRSSAVEPILYAQKQGAVVKEPMRSLSIRWDDDEANAEYIVGQQKPIRLTHQREDEMPQFVAFYLWAFPEGSTVAVERIVIEGVIDSHAPYRPPSVHSQSNGGG